MAGTDGTAESYLKYIVNRDGWADAVAIAAWQVCPARIRALISCSCLCARSVQELFSVHVRLRSNTGDDPVRPLDQCGLPTPNSAGGQSSHLGISATWWTVDSKGFVT